MIAPLLSKKDCIEGLDQITEIDALQAQKADEGRLIRMMLKQIPLMTEFLKNLDETGTAVSELDLSDKSLSHLLGSAEQLGKVFHGVSIGLAGLDVFRLFFIYLNNFVMQKKIEFQLTREARMAYALSILALGILAFTIPYAAPVIIVTAAALTLVGSTIALGYGLYKLWSERRELKKLQTEITEFEQTGLQDLKERARKLTKDIQEADLITEQQKEAFKKLQEELKAMQAHYNRRADLLAKKAAFSPLHIVDRGMGVIIAAVALAGLVISLYFPPIGFGILAGAAVLGASYVGARLAWSLGQFAYNRLFPKTIANKEVIIEQNQDEPEAQDEESLQDSITKELSLLGVKPKAVNSAAFQDDLGEKPVIQSNAEIKNIRALQSKADNQEDEDDDRDSESPDYSKH